MTKTEYAEYLQSEHWQQRRKKAIAEVGHRCEQCSLPRWVAALLYDQDLHVHHRNYQNLGDEQDDDLEVLCRRCHDVETFGRSNFREIKSTECSACGDKHCNPYSDYCDTCRLILEWGTPNSVMWNLCSKDADGEELWINLIYHALLARQICPTDLVVVLGKAIQKIDADYEAYRKTDAYRKAQEDANKDVPF